MSLFWKHIHVPLFLMLIQVPSFAQGRIAFYSDRDGDAEIHVMEYDGTGVKQLTFDAGKDVCPDWSPDGERIVFLSDRDGDYEIYVMDADGGNLKKLTDNDDYEMHPDWSHDGRQIAFVSDRDGNDEIYVMDADGGNPRRLTVDSANDMRPDWSPDGRKIMFNSYRDGNWEIYTMDADGSNIENLTKTTENEIFPRWSPDGTRIAFHTFTPSRGHVYIMNADGTNRVQLTFHAAGEEDAVWSSDGEEIIFQSSQDGNFELYKVKAAGGAVERITFEPGVDMWPCCARNLGRLEAAPLELSASLGGRVDFLLEAGPGKAGCGYLLLAGINGTGPGIVLPGGSVMPVRRDRLTSIVWSNANSAWFSRFMALLDGQGGSRARLDSQGPMNPLLAGRTAHFAYAVQTPPWWTASNAVAIDIVP